MKPPTLLSAFLVAASFLLANAMNADAAPFAYVTLVESGAVTVIDTATDTVVATIPVGAGPNSAVVNSTGTRVYVANAHDSTVSVIDTTTNSVVATIDVGPGPVFLATNPAGTRVYVSMSGFPTAGTNKKLVVIDTASNTIVATIAAEGFGPAGLAVNPAGTRLYVHSGFDSALWIIDTSTNAIVARVGLVGSRCLSGVVVDPSGSNVYVGGCDARLIHVLDTDTNTVVNEISIPQGRPGALALNRAGTRLYVGTGFEASTVTVIDTTTNSVVAVIPVEFAGGIDLIPDGTRVYVTGGPANAVFVIYAATNAIVNTIGVCCHPISAWTGFIGSGPPVIQVSLDIKPGSDPNSINLSSAGNIPAAILSTVEFDAPALVDPESLRLAGAAVNLIGKSSKFQCSSQDVNTDGFLDLVCHFDTTQFMIELGESMAVLEGRTVTGVPIRGEDTVRIVPE